MALRYLLDTNVLSEPVKPEPRSHLVRRLENAMDECATATVVLHEIEFGILRLPRSRRRDLLGRYLDAAERARLAARGRLPSFVDGQIASVAKVRGLVLVTSNPRDFAVFNGLPVEHWSA